MFDVSDQEDFAELIKELGVKYTFTHTTQGAYDPATGTTTDTISTYTAYAVRDEFSAYERNDSSIAVGDIKMIGESANYAVDDTVTIDSIVYKIMRAAPVKPGATTMVYNLQLRA